MCRRGGSPSSCGFIYHRALQKQNASNKSEDEKAELVYTAANKAENPFFLGSEQTVGKKTEVLPLLLKTAGTDSSEND